ncbi:peptidoglycan-binding domain 1 [Calothrix parasitica NIES-267]|uniref:Peptidoglycan-binding domain 1 n=1 Tax=Calothrix parasitica NIES-267 TaxID=1973488 RepID=A0A1Z4LNX4_9CYAN|nr:peptidoglycan-binding domain 1 [Calothrix parasitica NIES-267]
MTVLGLLVASFVTQGQPFLPTFPMLVFQPEKVQHRLFDRQRLSTFVVRISSQSNLSSTNIRYQKILFKLSDKISHDGSRDSIRKHQGKVTFKPVLKDLSISAKPFVNKSLPFNSDKEWDTPQIPLYEAEERLLAQYFQGRHLPVLRYGNSGNAVRVLQTLLTYNRYSVGINGSFDVWTETAVKAFQANRRLTADGIVGSRTWRELTRYARYQSKRDPMEIPMFGNQPLYPWQGSFRGNFAESSVSI